MISAEFVAILIFIAYEMGMQVGKEENIGIE